MKKIIIPYSIGIRIRANAVNVEDPDIRKINVVDDKEKMGLPKTELPVA